MKTYEIKITAEDFQKLLREKFGTYQPLERLKNYNKGEIIGKLKDTETGNETYYILN